jgi:hypothetical protein
VIENISSAVFTSNGQNIYDDDDEIGNIVCNKNKRYKEGKRKFVNNCKHLGQKYNDRKGKLKPKKIV